MINLKNDRMNVRFPEICNEYELNISFQRTLRIPDDGNDHFLPPSLGNFPLRHIEDFDLSLATSPSLFSRIYDPKLFMCTVYYLVHDM